jgi:hypothetical protein
MQRVAHRVNALCATISPNSNSESSLAGPSARCADDRMRGPRPLAGDAMARAAPRTAAGIGTRPAFALAFGLTDGLTDGLAFGPTFGLTLDTTTASFET